MHIEEAIRHRRSIRHYLPDPVPSTVIRDILALASMGPCISNRQMWRFIVVTDKSLRQMLERTIQRQIDNMEQWPEFKTQAQRIRVLRESLISLTDSPSIIFVINLGFHIPIEPMLVEHGMKLWEVADIFGYPDVQSIGGMIGYITLLAEDRGYGTCWMTNLLIAQKDLQATLELKSGEKIAAVISIGKPAELPVPKARKAIDELIEWR